MGRILLVLFVLLLLIAGLGVLGLGMFAPPPHPETVTHVIPADKLPAH